MKRLFAAAPWPLLFTVLLPALARAQEEAPPKGMPQLDFANPLTIGQIVWMVVVFVLLYVLLSSWALPKVGRVIGDRTTRIANDLDGARAAKAEADDAAREGKAANRRSHTEAQARINEAVDAAKRAAAAQAEAETAALDARLAQSEQRIAAARAEAMGSLADVAAAAASSMIERLSGRSPDPAAIHAAVGALVAARSA